MPLAHFSSEFPSNKSRETREKGLRFFSLLLALPALFSLRGAYVGIDWRLVPAAVVAKLEKKRNKELLIELIS